MGDAYKAGGDEDFTCCPGACGQGAGDAQLFRRREDGGKAEPVASVSEAGKARMGSAAGLPT